MLPFQVPSVHTIHSCLWHSHISSSIHLLSLSCAPPLFSPPFLRWWSRLVVRVRPAPLLRGYGFNLGRHLGAAHINKRVSRHNDLGSLAEDTPAHSLFAHADSLCGPPAVLFTAVVSACLTLICTQCASHSTIRGYVNQVLHVELNTLKIHS